MFNIYFWGKMGTYLWKIKYKLITGISYSQADEMLEKLPTAEDIFLIVRKEDLNELPKELAKEIRRAMGKDDAIIVAIG
jgi:hypothetical protein